MNILVACLGGTVSSRTNSDGVMCSGEFKFNSSFFEKIMKGPNYRIIEPVCYASENATLADYRAALKGIYDAVGQDRPDAILILHGTDSMAYFAQLAVRVLSILKLPVVITGSKLPQDAPGSDAPGNLRMALGLLDAAVEGKTQNRTFGVVFEDSFTRTASFVPAQQIMTSDIKGDHKAFDCDREDFSAAKYVKPAVDFMMREASENDNILLIPASPSFPFEAVSDTGYGPVLISCYHCGTVDSIRLPAFISRVSAAGHKVYMAPIPQRRKMGKKDVVYQSTASLRGAEVKELPGMPLEGAWAELAFYGQ